MRKDTSGRCPARTGTPKGRAEENVTGMARNSRRSTRRRTTLSDVALRAGVSAVTASRALRNPEMVSPALRERVADAVHELAYIPNQLASALASARTRTIGVVIPSLTNGVFADYLKALHDVF